MNEQSRKTTKRNERRESGGMRISVTEKNKKVTFSETVSCLRKIMSQFKKKNHFAKVCKAKKKIYVAGRETPDNLPLFIGAVNLKTKKMFTEHCQSKG